jgi:hypothetical protein
MFVSLTWRIEILSISSPALTGIFIIIEKISPSPLLMKGLFEKAGD